ncbi:MAG TPA: serine hydrolase [Bacteroidales bacterium]|nr:serine hydrolase [Bacteroidales bacterium]
MKGVLPLRVFITAFLCMIIGAGAHTQNIYPGKSWKTALPEKHGYDAKKLEEARKYIIDSMNTTGLVVVVNGEIIFSYCSIDRVSYLASCRKSILAMMYGNYVKDGTIDLNKTINDLGFDDVGGLLPVEKKARVIDLVTARSGVYHIASNLGDDRANSPERGSKEPGEYFLYNNWDFNVAGAAFEKMTGRNIFDAFQTDIAEPIELQDFERSVHVKAGDMELSRYPSYHFHLSTRDMARIGYLMLRRGNWDGRQVIPDDWADKIVSVVTPLEEMNPVARRTGEFGYGYMWWIFQGQANIGAFAGGYMARGAIGQYITVLPAADMVIAHKTDAIYGRSSTWRTYYKLLQMITNARIAEEMQ